MGVFDLKMCMFDLKVGVFGLKMGVFDINLPHIYLAIHALPPDHLPHTATLPHCHTAINTATLPHNH
jgi:hypothetical protein